MYHRNEVTFTTSAVLNLSTRRQCVGKFHVPTAVFLGKESQTRSGWIPAEMLNAAEDRNAYSRHRTDWTVLHTSAETSRTFTCALELI